MLHLAVGRFARTFCPGAVVMDKGYDAEWVHEAARDAGLRAVVPVRHQRWGSRTRGRHRRQMQREFESGVAQEAYSQRSKAETILSVIKRVFGSGLRSHSTQTRETELLYRVLAYNCHRACVISCVVLVMISRKPRDRYLL